MPVLDAYGHAGLPRFMTCDDFLRCMDAAGVERAVVAQAETCPDLLELSRGIVAHGDRLRAVGLPMGTSPGEIRESVVAQMEAGFLGIRLPSTLLARQPELLETLADAGGVPYVVGPRGLADAAGVLCDFLDGREDARAFAPHFAGGCDLSVFEADPDVARLFDHPRFCVIFSRQGAMPAERLLPWAREVVRRVGWGRILYGSEYPVCLWRDETFADTIGWLASTPLAPDAVGLAAFHRDNAEGMLFSRLLPPARLLGGRFQRMDLAHDAPVWLFPRDTIDLPGETQQRLIRAYLAAGGDATGGFRAFVTRVLIDAADRLD